MRGSTQQPLPTQAPEHGLSFDARILVREGPFKGKGARHRQAWAAKASGIRVYLEGFRILPYGDDDWLRIDADYTTRARQLEMLKDWPLAEEFEDTDRDEGLTRLTHNNYFGGVFLTQERAPTPPGPRQSRGLRAGGRVRHAGQSGSHRRGSVHQGASGEQQEASAATAGGAQEATTRRVGS